jgi:heme oxygenase
MAVTQGAEAAGLANALRARVRKLHTQAERGGIVRDVLDGAASLAGYLALLRNLLPGYQAMEVALARQNAPYLAGLARPELYRAGAIAADLDAYAPSWRTALPVLASGQNYAARIEACGGAQLIAHAYTRYLGDLNGGAVIARQMAPLLGGQALRFHSFPDIANLAAFRREYRAEFDRAGSMLGDWSPVLEEAALAFRMNIDISEEVRREKASF